MEFNLVQNNGVAQVNLSGIINEDAELSLQKLATEIAEFKTVAFQFAQVRAINSLGVRAWVTFLRSIEDTRQLFFLECVPDVIMQINMIPSFQGKAVIQSFFVNYVSAATNKTHRVLIDTSNLPPKSMPTPPNCPDSGEPMETEELEEEYFAFLLR